MYDEPGARHSHTSRRSSRSHPKKAAASGWIGSALEYYDFAHLRPGRGAGLPDRLLPEGQPDGRARRRPWPPTPSATSPGRSGRASWGTGATGTAARTSWSCAWSLMGCSTFAVGLLPTYAQVGVWAPILLVLLRIIQGFAVAGELGGASAMIVEHAPFGRRGYYASFPLQGTQAAADHRRGRLPAAVRGAVPGGLPDLGLADPVPPQRRRGRRRLHHPPPGRRDPGFPEEEADQRGREGAGRPGLPRERLERRSGRSAWRWSTSSATTVVVFGAAYATQTGYGVGMSTTLYLWIPIAANVVAIILIPFFGSLSDRIGRRPLMIFGALGAGVLSIPYLYAVSQKNEPLTIVLASWRSASSTRPGTPRSPASSRSCSPPAPGSPGSPSRRTSA